MWSEITLTFQECNRWIYFCWTPESSRCPFPCMKDKRCPQSGTKMNTLKWSQHLPDFRSPRQTLRKTDPLRRRVWDGRRHDLITLQGKWLRLQRVVVVIVFLLVLAGVVRLVRVLLVERVQIVLFYERLHRTWDMFKKKRLKIDVNRLDAVMTLWSLLARRCCCSMRSDADAGGDAALILLTTQMLSSGSGGRSSVARILTLLLCNCSNPPRVN